MYLVYILLSTLLIGNFSRTAWMWMMTAVHCKCKDEATKMIFGILKNAACSKRYFTIIK
jgi:hypothetical protein